MSSWLTALRIARREAKRARGRSALVVCMIALPVAFLAFIAVLLDTFRLSPQETADRLMGTAEATISWPYDGPIQQHPTSPDSADLLAVVSDSRPPPTHAPSLPGLLALLPPGTRAITRDSVQLTMRTATGVGQINAEMLNYADPLAHGIYRPLSGRAPASTDEVALTPEAVHRLGARVGDSVRLADGSRAFRVVGTVEDPNHLTATTMLLRPGAVPAPENRADRHYLVATPGPLTWAQVRQLNEHGIIATSRFVLAHPPDPADVPLAGYAEGGGDTSALVLVAGLAVLEVVLLAGPAFAVGARRRRRDLALVAATGATPRQLRRIVLADGVVLGGLAAVAGIGLGAGAVVTGRPLLEELSHLRSGGLRLYPLALAGLAGLALLTGVLAALVPAWVASRQEVVAALAGRRGIVRSRRRWVALGVVLVAAGVAVAGVGAYRIRWTIILSGLAVAELGLVLCTPALVGLVARLGRPMPLAARVALRDAARNRSSAAPAISAVMAAVVGSIAAGVILTASTQRAIQDYRTLSRIGQVSVLSIMDGPKGSGGDARSFTPETVGILHSTLPVEQVVRVDQPSCAPALCIVWAIRPAAHQCPYSLPDEQHQVTAAEQRAARHDRRCDDAGRRYTYFGGVSSQGALTLVVDENVAAVAANLPAEDAAAVASALRGGAVVVADPSYLDGDRATLMVITPDDDAKTRRSISVPGFALPHRPAAPVTMMTPATARSLGLSVTPLALVATTTRMPTVAEQDRARAALGERLPVFVEEGPHQERAALITLAIVAGLIALAATAIATGLAAADGRAELATLAAVGASPRLRRLLSVCQSAVIAGLGSVLGALAGLGAAVAVLMALNQRYADLWPAPTAYPIVVPWLNLVVAVAVVPVVAILGAGLLTRSRLPIERRP
jgi:putative ABC transport system permease protein